MPHFSAKSSSASSALHLYHEVDAVSETVSPASQVVPESSCASAALPLFYIGLMSSTWKDSRSRRGVLQTVV